MDQSIQIVKFAGIPVKVHWTFSLLILFVIGLGVSQGMSILELSAYVGFVLVLFVCVVLHEYGHALMAKRYGIRTIDIIISPIGGVARLQKLPEKPIKEMIVAIAGPLVNIVIAIVLLIVLFLVFNTDAIQIEDEFDALMHPAGFIALVIWTNLLLFVFNLIPAFPMDGGRILRAMLAIKYPRLKATVLASSIGKFIAILFIGLSFFPELPINNYLNNYILIFIGIFIFVMANRETQSVKTISILKEGKVEEVMNTKFSRIHLSEPVRNLIRNYIAGGEKNYVIFDSLDTMVGVVPELFLKDAFKNDPDAHAMDIMSKSWIEIKKEMTLDIVFEKMNSQGVALAVIKNGDQILGVLDRHMLQVYMQLHEYKG